MSRTVSETSTTSLQIQVQSPAVAGASGCLPLAAVICGVTPETRVQVLLNRSRVPQALLRELRRGPLLLLEAELPLRAGRNEISVAAVGPEGACVWRRWSVMQD